MNGPTRASVLTWRRGLAMAITEQLEAETIEAWRYRDEWRALAQAGVLPEDIRHGLDRDVQPCQAGEEIATWERYGGRGSLVLCGAKDSAKTFSAVQWARRRHADGLATTWVNGAKLGAMGLDERNRVMRAAIDADGLVLDDLGAGVTTHEGVHTAGSYMRKQLEGLIHARGQRPTIITSNMNAAETAAFLGPRITSRQEQAGGIVAIEAGLELRAHDGEDADPVTGHGARWLAADRLVRALGCERVERWIWAPNMVDGKYAHTFEVGRELERSARWNTKRLRAVTQVHELDAAAIRSRAVVLATQIDEDEKIGRLQRQQVAMHTAAIADTKRRAKTCYDALAAMRDRPRSPVSVDTTRLDTAKLHPRYSGRDGPHKMKALGFELRRQWDGLAVYHGKALKLCGFATEDDAWDGCAKLLGLGL